MKIIGLILIFAFCFLFGVRSAIRQNEIAEYADKSYRLLCRLRMLLRYSHPEKKALLERLSNEGFGEILSRNYENPDSVISDILSEYLFKLGSRDLDGELEALDFTIESVKSRMDEVKQNSAQNCKLFVSLGILAGAFAVIILV